jgi:hypothetical protein
MKNNTIPVFPHMMWGPFLSGSEKKTLKNESTVKTF